MSFWNLGYLRSGSKVGSVTSVERQNELHLVEPFGLKERRPADRLRAARFQSLASRRYDKVQRRA
jgi:hypothetical protein